MYKVCVKAQNRKSDSYVVSYCLFYRQAHAELQLLLHLREGGLMHS